jgi:hypothetical protein
MAKRVGEASGELFLALFVAECGPLSQVHGSVAPFLKYISSSSITFPPFVRAPAPLVPTHCLGKVPANYF